MSDGETYEHDGARCPYCGHLHIPEHDNWELFDENTSEWECHSERAVQEMLRGY